MSRSRVAAWAVVGFSDTCVLPAALSLGALGLHDECPRKNSVFSHNFFRQILACLVNRDPSGLLKNQQGGRASAHEDKMTKPKICEKTGQLVLRFGNWTIDIRFVWNSRTLRISKALAMALIQLVVYWQ
jgi:hypothetical protein